MRKKERKKKEKTVWSVDYRVIIRSCNISRFTADAPFFPYSHAITVIRYVARGPGQRMKERCEISYSVTRDLHPLESQGYVATSFRVFKKKRKGKKKHL